MVLTTYIIQLAIIGRHVLDRHYFCIRVKIIISKVNHHSRHVRLKISQVRFKAISILHSIILVNKLGTFIQLQ